MLNTYLFTLLLLYLAIIGTLVSVIHHMHTYEFTLHTCMPQCHIGKHILISTRSQSAHCIHYSFAFRLFYCICFCSYP